MSRYAITVKPGSKKGPLIEPGHVGNLTVDIRERAVDGPANDGVITLLPDQTPGGGVVIQTCPCDLAAQRYDQCCGRLHRGAALAQTPVELMRSRYSAYALGNLDYVLATWHPGTRPDSVSGDGLTWTALEVLGHGEDWVEFTAHYRTVDGTAGTMTERSLFERRAGRWFYATGDVSA